MNTDEQMRVIGEPTELLVQEALFLHNEHSGRSYADEQELLTELVNFSAVDDRADAEARLLRAMSAGDVVWEQLPNQALVFMLDEVVAMRHRRRMWFWHAQDAGTDVPAHLRMECTVVRAAVSEWSYDHNEPPALQDVLAYVVRFGGYDDPMLAQHVVLNALDAGAVRVIREAMETRWYITEGWTQS